MEARFATARSCEQAIEVFKLTVEAYPDSWNAYDSLAQAYATRRDLAKNDLRLAEENYQKSLQLNPRNANAAAALQQIKQP